MMPRTQMLLVRSTPRRRRRLRVLVTRPLSLAVMILVASSVSIRLAMLSGGIASVWIVNGLTIGMFLCTNPRRRNQLIPVTFLASFLGNRFGGETGLAAIGYALANTLEVFIATFPFRRMPVRNINLSELRTLLKAAVAAPIVGCAAGIITVVAWAGFVTETHFSIDFFTSFYCSDALGAAVIIPLYWSWRRKPRLIRKPVFRNDALLAFLVSGSVVTLIFWQTRYPLLFLAVPTMLAVVYTSGFLGAARAVLVTTVVGTVATAYGHGPLVLIHTTPAGRILFLQFYLAVALVTAFPFAALLMERERLVLTLQKSETRYRDLARLDGLTQLPNRREFDSFLDISRQRSTRQNTPFSLLLIDIDHFKKLNDQHGHTMGDDYLQRMAVAVASAVPRKTDLVARYGGEEFAVVLDSCDDAGAMMVAERIKATVAAMSQKLVAGNKPAVSVSIGVATTLPFMQTPSKVLIDAADQGLYAAKRNGRDRIERGTDLIANATAALLTTHS